MALPKCSCIVVLMGLLSLSICSALQTPTFPSMPLPENAEPVTINTESGLQGGFGGVSPPGASGYAPHGGGYPGGWGGGNGYPGAGGFGHGGWGGNNGYPGAGAGAGGGYPGAGGAGGGYPGAGGAGGGEGMSPPAGEAVYCRPVNCDNPNTCRGFTVYLNSVEDEASYIMS